jgi:hypothetical protein
MRFAVELVRFTGSLTFVVVAAGTSACVTSESPDESGRAKAAAVVPVETEAALERVGAIRARFTSPRANEPVIGDGAVLRFERLAGGRVHPVASQRVKGGLSMPARVELPERANGEVSLEDEGSHVAVRFAPMDAVDARLEIARGGLALYRGAVASGDVVHRVHAEGTEDFVAFDTRPAREVLAYRVDVQRVAGLRLVSDTLEFLDASGTPRLRVAPPYVVDASGTRHAAHIAVEGCAYDTDPAGPWGRPTVAPGMVLSLSSLNPIISARSQMSLRRRW